MITVQRSNNILSSNKWKVIGIVVSKNSDNILNFCLLLFL